MNYESITITDIIVLVLAMLFFYNGWRKGLMDTLIAPGSFIVSSIASILYFDLTQNIPISLLVVITGTVCLSFMLHFILAIERSAIVRENRDSSFVVGRTLGGVISTYWKGIIVVITLLLITIIPADILKISMIQTDIKTSITYNLIDQHYLKDNIKIRCILNTLKVFVDKEEMERIAVYREFDAFFFDQRIISLIEDETITEQINRNQIIKLASNPLVWKVLKDNQLMAKLTQLAKRVHSIKMQKELTPQAY